MTRIYTSAALMVLIITAVSFIFHTVSSDAIFYVSLNRAIQLGQYEGSVSVGALKKHGDFGLGSEEKLASELVLLNGVAYGIPATGNAVVLPDHTLLPFAAVKFFKTDKKVMVTHPLTFPELKSLIDSVVTDNAFAAVKITGTFSSIQFRSYKKAERPYRSAKEADSVVFLRTAISGVMVGFITPKAAEVLNSPEHHFHFIDSGKTTGGHVLEGTLQHGFLEIDYSRELTVALPDPSTQHIDLNKRIEEE